MTCAKFKDLYKRSDLNLQKQGDKRNNMQNSKQPERKRQTIMFQHLRMELAVWDYDRLGPSELLGSVVIGWNEKSNETTLSRVSAATHWQQMLENPRRPIVYWHQLKVKLQPALPVKTLCPFFVQCILLYSGFLFHVVSFLLPHDTR